MNTTTPPRRKRHPVLLAVVALIVGVALVTACSGNRPARGFHSFIADVWVPKGATLDPKGNSTTELWYANNTYGSTVEAMNSLLPVNQPLDGLPWCGSKTRTNSTDPTDTFWAWGTSTDMVDVGVVEIEGTTMITISHGPPSSGVCQPGA